MTSRIGQFASPPRRCSRGRSRASSGDWPTLASMVVPCERAYLPKNCLLYGSAVNSYFSASLFSRLYRRPAFEGLPMTDTIFITGASGQLGRAHHRPSAWERASAPASIIAGDPQPGKLAELAAQGRRPCARRDFDDPVGLEKAFAGADTVARSSRPMRWTARAPARGSTRLRCRRRRRRGAKRVAYTSLPEPETSKVSFAPDHLGRRRR